MSAAAGVLGLLCAQQQPCSSALRRALSRSDSLGPTGPPLSTELSHRLWCHMQSCCACLCATVDATAVDRRWNFEPLSNTQALLSCCAFWRPEHVRCCCIMRCRVWRALSTQSRPVAAMQWRRWAPRSYLTIIKGICPSNPRLWFAYHHWRSYM